jgi:hypothetical protein
MLCVETSLLHLDLISSYMGLVSAMVCNVTFNNISVISWRSVLLVEETRVHGENHRFVTSHNFSGDRH